MILKTYMTKSSYHIENHFFGCHMDMFIETDTP